MLFKSLFIVFLLLQISLAQSQSKTYVVTSDAAGLAGPGLTFEKAIDLVNTGAGAGDTILINIALDLSPSTIINITKNCVLIGNAPVHTQIRGTSFTSGNVIKINSNAIVEFQQMRFYGKSGSGSFIENDPGCTLKFKKCVFKDNAINVSSSGAAISNFGSLVLSACSFTNNTINPGQGKGGAVSSSGNLNIVNCSFHGCSADNGGAIDLLDGQTEIEFCTFYNCSAVTSGGAIFYGAPAAGTCKVTASMFHSSCSAASGPYIFDVGSGGLTSGGANMMNDNAGIPQFSGGNNDLINGANNYGLRPAGVVVDGYGMEWIPITDQFSDPINLAASVVTTEVEDIRRAPRNLVDVGGSPGPDCGAAEHTFYRITTNAVGGGGSWVNAWAGATGVFDESYIEFDLPSGQEVIPLSSPNVCSQSGGAIRIDAFTQPGSVVPGPFSNTGNYVPSNCVVEFDGSNSIPQIFQLGLREFSISGLSMYNATQGITSNYLNNHYFGNHFGARANGDASTGAVGLSAGVVLDGVNDMTIGGDRFYHRNTFANCSSEGIILFNGGSNNHIGNNIVGLDASGNSIAFNAPFQGVLLQNAALVDIENSVISGCNDGIVIDGSDDVLIIKNKIGTDASGMNSLGNTNSGMRIFNTSANLIQIGVGDDEVNVISGNDDAGVAGILIEANASNVQISHNFFGLAADGINPLGNYTGIHLENNPGCTIGGPNFDNINFFVNNVYGIFANNSTGSYIGGNAFGLDTSGTGSAALGNDYGIHLNMGGGHNIGGPNDGNLICYSNNDGINIDNNATGGLVMGNIIGEDKNGNTAGNVNAGLFLGNGADSWAIGGINPGEPNLIAHNGVGIYSAGNNNQIYDDTIRNNIGHGIDIDGPTSGNEIKTCIIYDNGGNAIHLATGGNEDVPTPQINYVTDCNGELTFEIELNGYTGPDGTFEIYRIPNGSPTDPSGGEGNEPVQLIYEPSMTTTYIQQFSIPGGIFAAGDFVSAIFTTNNYSTSQFSLSMEVQPTVSVNLVSQVDVSCNGGSDGSLDVSLTGGSGTFIHDWQLASLNFASTEDVTGLNANSYDLINIDQSGCADTVTFTINEPTALGGTISNTTMISCWGGSDGVIDVVATGGTPLYEFSSDGGSLYTPFNAGSNHSETGLAPGSYDIWIRDAQGCVFNIGSQSITQPTQLTHFATVSSASCNGSCDGSISITPSGGTGSYTYSSDNGTNFQAGGTFTGLCAGAYNIVVEDANGCQSASIETVNQPAPLFLSASHVDPSCLGSSDGSIDLTVTGGITPFTFVWGHGPTVEDVSGLADGSYMVTVTDANGCANVLSGITITEPSAVTVTVNALTDPSCAGLTDGSILITPSGGVGPYTFDWDDDGTGDFDDLEDLVNYGDGTYNLVVMDANGCLSANYSNTLTDPAPITANAGPDTTICEGSGYGLNGIVTVASGGVWTSSGSGAFLPSNNTLNATYVPSGADISAGSVTLLLTTTGNGTCAAVNDDMILTIQSAPNAGTNGSATICSNNITDLSTLIGTFDGGGTWSSPNGAANAALTGSNFNPNAFGGTTQTFYHVVPGIGPCPADTAIVTLSIDQLPTVNAGGDFSECSNTNPVLSGMMTTSVNSIWIGGAGSYSNPNDLSATYTPTGGELTGGTVTLTLYAVDTAGCGQVFDDVIITFVPEANAGTNGSANTCDSSTIDLSLLIGTFDAGGTWGTNDASVIAAGALAGSNFTSNGLVGGPYTIYHTVNGSGPCPTDTAFVTVNVNALPTVFAGADTSLCIGESITLTASGSSASYSWDNGVIDGNPFNPSTSLTYTVTATNAALCVQTDEVIITVNALPIVDITSTSITHPSCLGASDGEIQVAGSGGSIYNYSINEGMNFFANNVFSNLAAGQYILQVQDQSTMCISTSDTVTLNLGSTISISSTLTDLTCHGDNSGEILVGITGGNGTVESSIYGTDSLGLGNTGTPFNYTGLASGVYFVIAQDTNGCQSSIDTVTINEPAALDYNLAITDVCLPLLGRIEYLNVTGGTSPYDYSDDNGVSFTSNTLFDNLAPGVYNMTIEDDNGCRHDSTVTVLFNGGATPTITSAGPFCEGDVMLSASNGAGDAIVWYTSQGQIGSGSPFDADGLISDGQDVYALADDGSGCLSLPDSLIINVITNSLIMGSDQTICVGDSVEISASFGSGSFAWIQDGTIENPTLSTTYAAPQGVGTYYVAELNANGCIFVDSLLITIDINNPDCGLGVTNAFSPDGDGVNDTWFIEAVEGNGSNKVYIYSRWGDEIQTFKDYDNIDVIWDGTNKSGEIVPDGTYYYLIELTDLDQQLTGWVQITK